MQIVTGSVALFAAAGVAGGRTVVTSERPMQHPTLTITEAIRRCARCGAANYMAMHSPGCPNRTKTPS